MHFFNNKYQPAQYGYGAITAAIIILLTACSTSRQIGKQAKAAIFSDSIFNAAHVGISIYDPSTSKYLYNYQGDKYFVPASNTKLFTCYAAMKHLGDSLVGLQYFETDSAVILDGTGDPSFLHPDYAFHPVLNFLEQRKSKPLWLLDRSFPVSPMGYGWAWDDYLSDYMVERSFFPMYGNVADFFIRNDTLATYPRYFKQLASYDAKEKPAGLDVTRPKERNYFSIQKGKAKRVTVPFYTRQDVSVLQAKLLADTLHVAYVHHGLQVASFTFKTIYSQPTDSLLKPMMHRSDNFFAEQSLLMVSHAMMGVMYDAKTIDTLLKTDFKDIPQKPRWVDGSGLSRYNNFTPQSFVYLLNKMKNEFSWNRITTILATGNEGTLTGWYKNYTGRIFAKMGTLTGQVALSGYVITKKNKTLIFSVLVNNHQSSASSIRKAVEKFLSSVIEKY